MLLRQGLLHGRATMSDAWALQIAPKDDEQKACEQYTGRVEDLSPPEQFLLTMSSVPRLHDKINVLILMQQFQVGLEGCCCASQVPSVPSV